MIDGKSFTRLELAVADGSVSVDFYTGVLGGHENSRECLLDGHVLRADVTVGEYRLQIIERTSGSAAGRPSTVLPLICADPGAVAERCAAAGAFVELADRNPTVHDVDGHLWMLTPA